MSDEQAEDADASDDAETQDEATGIQDGDFLRLHYTIRTRSDDEVVDTTDPDVAEEAGIDDEEYDFEPQTLVVGAGHMFPAVDEELEGAESGDAGTVAVDAAEAFGEYDPDDVRTVSAEKIDEDDRYPGAQVTVDGQQGYIETIVGGRARVDFNHPLAGEDLDYEYEILEVVDDDEEKAAGMLSAYLQEEPDVRVETETVEEEVTVEGDDDEEEVETQETERRSLYVEATPAMQMNQQWMFQKQQVAEDVMDRLDLDRVVIEEVIDGSGGGPMGGMMGGMGGLGGAPGGEEGDVDDAEIDAEEIVEEIEGVEE